MTPREAIADALFQFDGLTLGRPDVSDERSTRDNTTLEQYAEHARSIVRQSAPPMKLPAAQIIHAIRWFVGNDEAWSDSTIRSYRAALFCLLERASSMGLFDPHQSKGLCEFLTGEKYTLPKPRDKRLEPRTSARKRKAFDLHERASLMHYLANQKTPTAKVLCGLVHFGPELGLRFCEWLTAAVRGDVLIVKCAKATNGRAIAAERLIDLASYSELDRTALRGLLRSMKASVAEAGDEKKLHGRLAKALARACETLKIRKIALYTLRHQALATAKRSLNSREVAALAGHKTTRTASRHYASRRSGWKVPQRIVPTLEMVKLVLERGSSQSTPAFR